MGWIDNLINEIPSASHYRLELEAMQKENATLKEEIALLKSQLDAVRNRAVSPDRLDADTENVLRFISQQEYATTTLMTEGLSVSRQVVEMIVEELMKMGYIEPSYAGGDNAAYYLKAKGKRYLHSYGLL